MKKSQFSGALLKNLQARSQLWMLVWIVRQVVGFRFSRYVIPVTLPHLMEVSHWLLDVKPSLSTGGTAEWVVIPLG